jgi:tRNA(Ile)-lysidine synthetase-like protein
VALKSGRKKLQDLFVDQKIGRIARRQWPVVVTAQDEVVWVPGLAANPNLRVQAPADTVHYLTHELT